MKIARRAGSVTGAVSRAPVAAGFSPETRGGRWGSPRGPHACALGRLPAVLGGVALPFLKHCPDLSVFADTSLRARAPLPRLSGHVHPEAPRGAPWVERGSARAHLPSSARALRSPDAGSLCAPHTRGACGLAGLRTRTVASAQEMPRTGDRFRARRAT